MALYSVRGDHLRTLPRPGDDSWDAPFFKSISSIYFTDLSPMTRFFSVECIKKPGTIMLRAFKLDLSFL